MYICIKTPNVRFSFYVNKYILKLFNHLSTLKGPFTTLQHNTVCKHFALAEVFLLYLHINWYLWFKRLVISSVLMNFLIILEYRVI